MLIPDDETVYIVDDTNIESERMRQEDVPDADTYGVESSDTQGAVGSPDKTLFLRIRLPVKRSRARGEPLITHAAPPIQPAPPPIPPARHHLPPRRRRPCGTLGRLRW